MKELAPCDHDECGIIECKRKAMTHAGKVREELITRWRKYYADSPIPTHYIEGYLEAHEARQSEIDELVGLLSVAKCPDSPSCRDGIIPHQIGHGEWEPQQCQWCYEREQALAKHKEVSNG